MILKNEELDKLIQSYEKKSEEAYRNYQDSGHGRYWNTHKKYENLADTLKVAREYADFHRQASEAEYNINHWAGIVADMPYYTVERKELETKKILSEILEYGMKLSEKRYV